MPSAYLKFFELEQSPFEGKAQSKVVLGTRALRDAFAAIRNGLAEGSARICINGGPGLGKTSLARSLPKLLGDSARVAVVLDPSVPWESLRSSIAKQWGLDSGGLARAGLLEAARDTRLVMVVDRAEQATEDFLDHLDIILSVRSETDEPSVQSVLLACLSDSEKQEPPPLIWWLDRIQTLQLEFAPIPREGVASYIHKHLKRAGWRGEHLFSTEAALAIHGVTGGIPGEISSLCERLLAQAAESDLREIDADFVQAALDEESDEGEDGESTLEDEFEELVHEEEFEGAGTVTDESSDDDASDENRSTHDDTEAEPTIPSLVKTLEHFEHDTTYPEDSDAVEASEEEFAEPAEPPAETAVDAADVTDVDSLILLEEYLGAPASLEELQAIRRGVRSRQLRAAAAVAAAILICGTAFVWLNGDGDSSQPRQSSTTDSISEKANDSTSGPDDPVLARLRGPVTTIRVPPAPAIAPTPVGSEPTQSVSPTTADLASARNLSDDDAGSEDFDERLEPDDFVDMRPASMRPNATSNPETEERFW